MDTSEKKVTAFVGSARKKLTYEATEIFLDNLQKHGRVDSEIIRLCEHRLQICKGCKNCLDKGEEFCPLADERDMLIDKMIQSDGVVFATPNYSFQVSALMKCFIDRLGYFFHRPRFFGKTFTGIVVQGVYGGKKIARYFDFIGKGMGYNVVKSSIITSTEPMSIKSREKMLKTLEEQSKRYHKKLCKQEKPAPSLMDLMVFRMSRTNIKQKLNEDFRDYNYFLEQGWFTSDFFYPVRLNPAKKLTGRLFDRIGARLIK